MGRLQEIRTHAAGIDVGSEKIFIGLPDGSVQSFLTFTAEMEKGVRVLLEQQVTTVAMESTGVYGVVLYEMLEQAGLEVYLVNPSHVKHVPGRKTDVLDCQWLQQLHSYGLFNSSFIPDEEIKALRSYVRIREGYLQEAGSYVQRMQKSLTLMNIRLHQVISQIQGVSGMKVIKAILSGERNVDILVGLCHNSILKTKREQVVASLQGHYKAEHLYALQQAVDCYEFYISKIKECDQKLDIQLGAMNQGRSQQTVLSPGKAIRHHKPQIADYHQKMVTLMNGRDVTGLPGITDYNLMKLVAEVGTDLRQWPGEKHFTSWLGLAPGKHSSGKLIRKVRKKATPKAGAIFREAAQTLLQSKNIALGHFARRLRARKGSYVAIKATARKLAEMYYRAVTKGLEYVEQGVERYEKQIQETQVKALTKKAKELNMQLVPV